MRPERQFGASTSVNQPRSDNGRVRMSIELGDQAVDRAGRHDGVAVQQQHARACGGPYADVVRAREAQIRPRLDDLHTGPSSRRRRAAVGRLIVDDDDFVRERGSVRVKRLEAPLEIGSRVVADDDDRQIDHKISTTEDTEDAEGRT